MKTTKKWSKMLLVGMSAMVLVFTTVFAGCASTPPAEPEKIVGDSGIPENKPGDFKIAKIKNTSGVEIISYKGKSSVVGIPQKIKGTDVLGISSNAFSEKGITTVVIPEGIKTIGNRAFYGNNLTSVTIPNSVTDIYNHAFANNNLTEVIVTSANTKLKDNVFDGNKTLSFFKTKTDASGKSQTINKYTAWEKIITIPARINNIPVTGIEEGAFLGKGLSSITIPEGVVTIGNQSFMGNRLTSIIIPSSVKTIGDDAFTGENNGIQSISIGANVTLAPNCFNNDFATAYNQGGKKNGEYTHSTSGWKMKLVYDSYEYWSDGKIVIITNYVGKETNIVLPEKINGLPVTEIRAMAFYFKPLTNIVLPNTLVKINAMAFSGIKLRTLVIPPSVREIVSSAFTSALGEPDILNITIGSDVLVGKGAFGDMNDFDEVYNKQGKKAGRYVGRAQKATALGYRVNYSFEQ